MLNEVFRLARRNDQYVDVVNQLRDELAITRERLYLEHAKTAFSRSVQQGQAAKDFKRIEELEAQVEHASHVSASLARVIQAEKRNNEQLERDVALYASANVHLHDGIDSWMEENTRLEKEVVMWTDLQINTAIECGQLTLDVKTKDEQCELLKCALKESETKTAFFERQLDDALTENSSLRGGLMKLRAVARLTQHQMQLPAPVFAKRSHPSFPENRKREFLSPQSVIPYRRLKRAKAIVGAALAAEINEL